MSRDNVVRLVTRQQRKAMTDQMAIVAYTALDIVEIGNRARSIRTMFGLDEALRALGGVAQDLRNEGRKL